MVGNDVLNRVDPLGLDYFFGGPNGAGAGQDSFGLVHPYPTPPYVPNWGQGAQNYSANAASMIQQLRQRLPGVEGGVNVSWTFIWVPYPGGKWSVEASVSGSVVACKYADGRAGLMADVTVEISTQAGFGYGAGGNQGFKRDRNGRLHNSKGRFAKNPEKGFGGVEGEGSRTSECKLCENSLDGSITIEVGGKAGAGLSFNPYANVSFAFSDPLSFDYGVRAGFSGYIGAELYLKASAEGSGTLIVK